MINIRIKFRIDRTYEEEEIDGDQQQHRGCSKDIKPSLNIHIFMD
jgi:hypothetical protein